MNKLNDLVGKLLVPRLNQVIPLIDVYSSPTESAAIGSEPVGHHNSYKAELLLVVDTAPLSTLLPERYLSQPGQRCMVKLFSPTVPMGWSCSVDFEEVK